MNNIAPAVTNDYQVPQHHLTDRQPAPTHSPEAPSSYLPTLHSEDTVSLFLFPPQNVSSRGQTSCPVAKHAAGAQEMLAHEWRNDDHKERTQSNHKKAACFRKRVTEQKGYLDSSCRFAGHWLGKKKKLIQHNNPSLDFCLLIK